MMTLEVLDNPNCPPVDLRVFHDLGSATPIRQVRLSRDGQLPEWYDVTGWTTANGRCPALLQKVDDSGEGVAFLLYGGDAGLRLRPAGDASAWGLDDPRQWGSPFVLLTDLADVRLDTPTGNTDG
ncbi:MAG: hypothetical protein Q8R78_06020 [Candidatus Omnitrophota bacterium]|nr:hypothetical protein [Candidatus Omnitrophota bacterium]